MSNEIFRIGESCPNSTGSEIYSWYDTTAGIGFEGGQRNIMTASASAKYVTLRLQGFISVNAGGTLIPQYSFSAANQSSPITGRGSYFKLTPTTSTVGVWT